MLKGVCGEDTGCNRQLNEVVKNRCGAGKSVCCVPLPPAGPPVGRTGTLIPNSAACEKKGGTCGMPASCVKPGKRVAGGCAYKAWICCAPAPPLPVQPVITPPGPMTPTPVFTRDFLMGNYTEAEKKAAGFVKARYGGFLHTATRDAFESLRAACKKELGITLTVNSTSRSYADQKRLWEKSFGDPKGEETRLKKAFEVLQYRSVRIDINFSSLVLFCSYWLLTCACLLAL